MNLAEQREPAIPPATIGRVVAMFAFDIGSSIDLQAAAAVLGDASRAKLDGSGAPRMPAWFQFRPLPLTVRQPTSPLVVAGLTVEPAAELTIYDFGAVSVSFFIPLPVGSIMPDGTVSLPALLPLGEALYENAVLRAAAIALVDGLAATLGPAVRRPCRSELVEDYMVYLLPSPVSTGEVANGRTIEAMLAMTEFRREIAQLLAAETAPLSQQEVTDAVAGAVCFGLRDAVIADWAAAVVFGQPTQDGPTVSAANAAGSAIVLEVLRFANVELLEMRFMDDNLDEMLDEAYELQASGRLHTMNRRGRGPISRAFGMARDLLPGSRSADLEKLATLQVDAAILFESVGNALKLVGEPYLARVYRLAATRLHLSTFEANILRKQRTLDAIYQKAADSASGHRMEVLEWIVILLIGFEVVMSLVSRK